MNSREVTLLHKLKHPHVLTFYGISKRCLLLHRDGVLPLCLDAILSGGRVADDVCEVPMASRDRRRDLQ